MPETGQESARRVLREIAAGRASARATQDTTDAPMTKSELIHARAMERVQAEREAKREAARNA